MAVPEIRHVIHAYEAVHDCDVVHDHTVMGPFHSEHYPGLPVATTIHGPFNDELSDLYRPTPPVCRSLPSPMPSSERPRRPDRPGHPPRHRCLPLPGRRRRRATPTGPTQCSSGAWRGQGRPPGHRGGPDGRHPHPHGGQDARSLGDALLRRGGGAPPRSRRPVPRRGVPRAEARAAGRGVGAAVPDPVERAVRHGHDRGHGLRHPGAGLPRGCRTRGGRRRVAPGSSATTRRPWWRPWAARPARAADCRLAVEGYFSTDRMVAEHIELFERCSPDRAAGQDRRPNTSLADQGDQGHHHDQLHHEPDDPGHEAEEGEGHEQGDQSRDRR